MKTAHAFLPQSIKNVATVFRREMAAYFNSAVAYIFIIVFALLNGGLFMTQFFMISRADMRPFFVTLPFVLSVFLPAVTMRLWAEERRGNTLELLLTFPMKTEEIVAGKFAASAVFFLTALLATLPMPVMIHLLGRPDTGVMLSSYLGAVLLGSFYLSIGIFISGLCRDQIVAFILSLMVCFSLHLLGTEFIATSIDGWVPGFGSFLRHFVGSARHYESFAKGIIDNRDAAYFVIGSLIFLVLNGFWLEGRLRPKASMIFSGACVISAGIFLMANWFLSPLSLGRFDLTQGQIYTMAPATQKILRSLKAPVMVKLYISPAEKMPTGMKSLEQEVVDRLDEFRIAAKGRFQYKILHMEAANIAQGPDKGREESLETQLSKKGIQPFQVQSVESDEVGVKLVYASLGIAYREKPEEIIPRLMPESLYELEYSIVSKIFRLTLAEIPKIALVAPYEEKDVDPQLRALFTQLGAKLPEGYREDNYEILMMALQYEGYDVARIRLSEEEPVPPAVKTLVIVEPAGLSERQKYEINRFLHTGGSVFMAVQNYEFQYSPADAGIDIRPAEKVPGVNPLLKEWGFEVDESILADQQHEVINLSGGGALGIFQMAVPVKLPIQILIPPSQMNDQVSISSHLSSFFYLWGSALNLNDEKIKAQGLKVIPLAHSSRDSWTVPFEPWSLTMESLHPLRADKQGPFVLALMAEGQFADGYAGKPVPAWREKPEPLTTPEAAEGQKQEVDEDKTTEEAAPVLTPAPGKLILTGAATMFQRQLVQSGGHLNFFMNAVDVLSLSDELVSIRSKKPVDRTIGRVSTGAKVGWRFFSMFFVPAVLALAGALRVILRKRGKQQYMNSLTQG